MEVNELQRECQGDETKDNLSLLLINQKGIIIVHFETSIYH